MTRTRELTYLPQPFLDSRSGVVVAPFQFALDGNDVMRIKSSCNIGGVRLSIQGRRLSAAGEIEVFAFEHDTHLVGDRQIVTSTHVLGEGALLNLAVFATGVQPVIGEVFVMVQIVRGNTGPTVLLGTLLQGYVTATQGLGWPGSPILSSMDPAAGAVHQFAGTDPAAGSEWLETVPPGAIWEIIAIRSVLSTSAAAGARTVFLIVSAPFATLFAVPSPVSPGPLSAVGFQWVQGFPLVSAVAATNPITGLPPQLRLRGGLSVGSLTVGMDAADDYQSPQLLVREWLEVP